MTDLRDRFRSLERVRAPDLWSEVTQRASDAASERSQWPWAMSGTLRLGLVLLLLVLVTSIGIAVAGAVLRDDRTGPEAFDYEAVFLRLEVVDGSTEVHVLGVNTEGSEREIARLPGAWVAYDIGPGDAFLAPMGAMSPHGLLAIPSGRGDLTMQWNIFDVYHPEAEPITIPRIEQSVEELRATPYWKVDPRGGAFWGPGERLAILWYTGNDVDLQLSFIEGRTGTATPVDIPADMSVLPYWASDASGVFVGSGVGDAGPREILRADGSVAPASEAEAEASCRTGSESDAGISVSAGHVVRRNADDSSEELLSLSGAEFGCLAPDDSAIVLGLGIGDRSGTVTASEPLTRLFIPGSGASFDVQGSFAGWLRVPGLSETSEPSSIAPPTIPFVFTRPRAGLGRRPNADHERTASKPRRRPALADWVGNT